MDNHDEIDEFDAEGELVSHLNTLKEKSRARREKESKDRSALEMSLSEIRSKYASLEQELNSLKSKAVEPEKKEEPAQEPQKEQAKVIRPKIKEFVFGSK